MDSQVVTYNPSNYANEVNKAAHAYIKKQNIEIEIAKKMKQLQEAKMPDKFSFGVRPMSDAEYVKFHMGTATPLWNNFAKKH